MCVSCSCVFHLLIRALGTEPKRTEASIAPGAGKWISPFKTFESHKAWSPGPWVEAPWGGREAGGRGENQEKKHS